jgi:hypothetical protein
MLDIALELATVTLQLRMVQHRITNRTRRHHPVVGSIDRPMAEVRRIDGVTVDLQIRNQAQMTKL